LNHFYHERKYLISDAVVIIANFVVHTFYLLILLTTNMTKLSCFIRNILSLVFIAYRYIYVCMYFLINENLINLR